MDIACASSDTGRSLRIVTRRLVLRLPQVSDLDAIVAGLGDLRVSRMLARVPFPYGRADAEEFLALADQQNASGRFLHLVIDLGGQAIGGIGLHDLPEADDFGYWIAADHWGKGFASEAAVGILDHGFRVLGVGQVPSGVFVDNPASLRVQEKLGFRQVGTSRRFSLARACMVEHIDTLLTRAQFEEIHR
jgi:RimJ/RimL family protein N-acetyltransferase